jgi:fibronectin-binding autotransporter adhesin
MQPEDNSLDGSNQSSAYSSSLETTAPVVTSVPIRRRPSLFKFNRMAFTVTGATLAAIVLIAGAAFLINNIQNTKADSIASKQGSYDVGTLPVNGVKQTDQLSVGTADRLAVNGQLNVSNTVVLTPTSTPSAPEAGQIYYDKTVNSLFYYNGSVFVPVANQNAIVSSLGGMTGAVNAGAGLSAVGGSLQNTGVLSIQGQTGNVTFTAGGGVDISGTTVSLTALPAGQLVLGTGASGFTTVAQAAPGQCLISTAGAPVFGSCTGSTQVTSLNGLVNGLTLVPGAGIGITDNGSNQITITSSAGAAITQVNGQTGPILTVDNASSIVANHITINNAAADNGTTKGIASFNNINFSASGGVIDTIQGISTTATPTFATLTSSGFLKGTELRNATNVVFTLPVTGSGSSRTLCYVDNSNNSNCPTGGNVSYGTTHNGNTLAALDSSGNVIDSELATQTGGLQYSGSAYYLDLFNASATTLTVKNSSAGQVANLAVTGTVKSAGLLNGNGDLFSLDATPGGSSRTLCYVTNLLGSNCPSGGNVSRGGTYTTGQITAFDTNGNIVDSSILDQTNGLQTTNNAYFIDVKDASTSTLTVKNSTGGQLANLSVTGSVTAGNGLFAHSLVDNTVNGGGNELQISSSNNNIIFSINGGIRKFSFPTTGGVDYSTQTICTTAISCASGGGQAVLLEPGTSAQTTTSSDASIWVNRASGSGNILQFQSGGNDMFVLNSSGAASFSNSAGITIGKASTAGKIVLFSANNSNTLTLQTGNIGTSYTLTLPVAKPTGSADCLVGNTSGTLSFATCLSGSGGGSGVTGIETPDSNIQGGAVTFTSVDGSITFIGDGSTNIDFSAAASASNSANKTLSNLTGPTAVSESLTPGSSGKDLGSSSQAWQYLYLGAGANSVKIDGSAATTGRTITLDNLDGHAVVAQGSTPTVQTGGINLSGTIVSGGKAGFGQAINGSGAQVQVAGGIQSAGTIAGNNASLEGTIVYDTTTDKFYIYEGATGAIKEVCNKVDNACGASPTTTLQGAYTNYGSSAAVINLSNSGSRNGIVIQDAASTLGDLFTVANNGGGTKYLNVTNAGVAVTGLTVGSTSTFTGLATFNGGITDTGSFSQTGSGTFGTGTGAVSLNGATSVTGSNTLNVGTGLTTLGGGLTVSAGNVGITTGNFLQSGSGTFGTGTGAVSLNGATSVTGSNTLNVGTGLTTLGGGLTVSAGNVGITTGNFLQSGSGTFGTGTGAVSLNGATSVTGSNTLTVGSGATTLGGTLAVTGATTVTGGSLTVGTTSQIGSFALHDGNGQTTTLQAGDSAGNLTFVLPTTSGTTNQCVKKSSGNQLFFDDCLGGSGGSGGVSSLGAIDFAGTSLVNGAVISGSTLYLQHATATLPGLISVSAQTIAGAKTFNNVATFSAGITDTGAFSQTGATSINTSGSAATTIGNTSGGAVSILSGTGGIALTPVGTSSSGVTIQASTTNSDSLLKVNNVAGFNLLTVDANAGQVTTTKLSVAVGTTSSAFSVTQNLTGDILQAWDAGTRVFNVADGGAAQFKNSTNSTIGFQVQNAAGTTLLNTDTLNSVTGTGASGKLAVGTLLSNGQFSAGSSTYSAGTISTSGSSTTVTGSGTTFTSAMVGATIYFVDSSSTNRAETITAVASGTSLTIGNARNISASTAYTIVYGGNFVSSTGATTIQATTNTTTAFQIQNAAGTTLVNADTSNMRLSIGSIGTATGQLYVSSNLPTAALNSRATGTNPNAIYVQGRYAYVVNTNNASSTLAVYDISDPANIPAVIGSVTTGVNSYSVYVQGKYAYVGTSTGMLIYNISNPSSIPAALSTTTLLSAFGNKIYVQGRYAYIAQGIPFAGTTGYLQIVDIANPAAPVNIGSYSTGDGVSVNSVFVQGRYAYLAVSNGTLRALDISNPASPSLASSRATTSSLMPFDVYVQGRYAYVGTTTNVDIFDISNPASIPVVVGTVVSGGGVNPQTMVSVQGRYVYALNAGTATLQLIDVSSPSTPTSIGTVPATSIPFGIYVQGRYAFTVSRSAGNVLQSFDLGGAYSQSLEAGSIESGTINTRENLSVGNDADIRGGLTVGGATSLQGNLGVNGSATFANATNSTAAFQVQTASGSTLLGVDTVNSQVSSLYTSVTGGLNVSTGLSPPAAPTVQSIGTNNSKTFSYAVTARNAAGGETIASSNGTTATGANVLCFGSLNRITWAAVAGAKEYRVYRTATNATNPSSTGLIATTTALTFDDDSCAVATGTVPTYNSSGDLTVNTGAVINATATSTIGLAVNANSLTTGTALGVTSTSALLTTGNLASINQSGAYTTPLSIAGNLLSINRNPTISNSSSTNVTLDAIYPAGGVPAVIAFGSSISWSHTVGYYSNRILVVDALSRGGSGCTATYGSQTMTQVSNMTTYQPNHTTLVLVNPIPGTATITVTCANDGTNVAGTSSSWYNVDPTTPYVAVAPQGQNNGHSGTSTITSGSTVANDVMIGGFSGTTASTPSGTPIAACVNVGYFDYCSEYKVATTTTTALTYASSSFYQTAFTGVVLKHEAATALSLDGAVVNITSNCTGTGGATCNDVSNLINLNQQLSSATGVVLKVQNAGVGATLQLNNTSTGKSVDIQSNGTSTFQITNVSGAEGAALFRNRTNNSNGFQVQKASGASLFNIDTTTTNNLLGDGDVEGAITNWGARGSSTVSQVTTQQYQGNKSLQVATTTAANDGAYYYYSPAASTVYNVSFYAKVASGSITDVNIGYQNFVGTDNDCLTGQTLTATWKRFSCSFTSGGFFSSPNIYIKKTGVAAETFFVDGLQLEAGTSATAFDAGGRIQFGGIVNSPVTFQNKNDSSAALQVQNSAGSNLLLADTGNMRVSVGSQGVATGQLFISGSMPSANLSYAGTASSVSGVAVQGRYAYVSTGTNTSGFQVFDVSNPASPLQIGSANQASAASKKKVKVQGKYAYVSSNGTSNTGTFEVFDISNPKLPVSVGSQTYTTTASTNLPALYVYGRYAYVGDGATRTLWIFDVSNPAIMPTAIQFTTGVSGSGIADIWAAGKYLYLANAGATTAQFQVLDISTPTAPTVIGTISNTGGAGTFISGAVTSLAVQGRYAYVGNSTGSVFAVDLKDPAFASPVVATVATSGTGAASLYAQGRILYVADNNSNRISAVDISTPGTPIAISSYSATAGSAAAQAVIGSGRYLYVGTGNSTYGFQVFDIGGTYTQQLEAGGVETNTLSVRGNSSIVGDETIQGSLSVGSSAIIQGDMAVGGTSKFTGNLTANNYATSTATYSTTVGATTNTTSVTVNSATGFAVGDVIFIDNGGANQDYYTRITGIASNVFTVSPEVSVDANSGATPPVTKYIVQNVGSISSTLATPATSDRFFQGYFLGGVVTGAGSTTLSDGSLKSTVAMNFNSPSYNFVTSSTTTNALAFSANSLTTGNGINISSSSSTLTSGNVANVLQAGTYTSTATVSGSSLNVSRSETTSSLAVTVDNTSTKVGGGNNSINWTHTVGANSNMALIVAVNQFSTVSSQTCSASYTAPSMSAQPMTLLTNDVIFSGSNYRKAALFGLISPNPGAGSVTVTCTSDLQINASAVSMYNVDVTSNATAFGNVQHTNDSTNSPIIQTVTGTTTKDKVVDTYIAINGTAGGGQTSWGYNLGGSVMASYKDGSATSTTMSWTIAPSDYKALAAVAVKSVPGAALTVSGAAVNFASNCTVSSGTCTDTGNVLKVTQSYASASGTAVLIQNAGTGLGMKIQDASANNALAVDTVNRYVGIGGGAGTPTSALYVRDTGSVAINVSTSTSTSGSRAYLGIGTPGRTWTLEVAQGGAGNCTDGKLCFVASGIGAGASIDTSGNFRILGSYSSLGTPDISESIPVTGDVEAADVVSADPGSEEHAIKTSIPYDPKAIGIISDGSSAFKIDSQSNNIGDPDTGKYLVLAGRVPVKVTDEGGPVVPGDYLTSSSTPGYAMKATHAGPTIGKSLGFFSGTSGTVMVQTNLGYADPQPNIQGSNGSYTDLNVSGIATIQTLSVTGSATFHGNIIVGGHVITAGNTPDTEVLGAAGAGASITIDGNDTAGTITITTGGGATAGDLGKLIFNNAFGKAPKTILSAQDEASQDAKIFPTGKSASQFILRTSQALPAGTYTFDYFIVQ